MTHLEKLAAAKVLSSVAGASPKFSTRELERLLPLIQGGAGAEKTLAPQVELIRKYLASVGAKTVQGGGIGKYPTAVTKAHRIPG